MELDSKLVGIAVTGAISLITAVLGFYFGQQKILMEYNKDVSIEIWRVRNTQYKELLKIMGVLPKWPSKKGEVTYQDLLDTSEKLKKWYFGGGGLYLTLESRDIYFDIQELITQIVKEQVDRNNSLEEFITYSTKHHDEIKEDDKKEYEKIRGLMSSLRTELTNDLLSRKRDHFNPQNDQE